MSLTIHEYKESRSYSEDGKTKTLERVYIIEGSDNPEAVEVRTKGPQLDAIHPTMCYMKVSNRRLEPLTIGGDKGAVKLTVTYQYESRPGTGEGSFEWDIGTETEHITRAKSQTHYPGVPQADVGEFVNSAYDGSVGGTDVYRSREIYTVVRTLPDEVFSLSFRNTLRGVVGKVNNAAWKDFEAGEVLFLGAAARKETGKPWVLTYRFLISKNSIEQFSTVLGPTGNIHKKGWQLIWFRNVAKPNVPDQKNPELIHSVHLATLYDEADFTVLEL